MSHEFNPLATGRHVYDGICYDNVFPAEDLDRMKKFTLRKEDVVVSTYPKAGTTWMLKVVKSIDDNSKDGPILHHKTEGLKGRDLFMEFHWPGKTATLDIIEKLEGPRLLMSHLQPYFFQEALDRKTAKFVIMIRNEKDCLVSWYHWHKKSPNLGYAGDWNEFYEDYKKDKFSQGNWNDWNLDWFRFKDHENVLFIKFEDMKEDPKKEIEKIAKFMGREILDVDKICLETSFDNMMNVDSKRLRKGIAGGWKEYFTPQQSEDIDKLYQLRCIPKGLTVRFEL